MLYFGCCLSFYYMEVWFTQVFTMQFITFLALIFGNFIVYIIFNNFDIRTNLRAIVALSIFPLLFSNSNVSFFGFIYYHVLICL